MIATDLPTNIEGIVIDAVGTLIEPRPSVARTYAEAALRQGISLDEATVKSRFHKHFGDDEVDEQRGRLATDEATENRRWRRIVSGVLPEVPDPDLAFAELWDHFGRPESWRVFDDVSPAITALRDVGLSIGIGSNFDARLRRVIAGHRSLSDWAERVVISSEIGRRKPHPDFYQAVCTILGHDPSRVLSAGDDIENDVLGARRAGLHAALIDRAGKEGKRSEALRFSNLMELTEALVGRLSRSTK